MSYYNPELNNNYKKGNKVHVKHCGYCAYVNSKLTQYSKDNITEEVVLYPIDPYSIMVCCWFKVTTDRRCVFYKNEIEEENNE